MSTEVRWTSADLEQFPDNGLRYEIIDGELYVAKQPNWYHQYASGRIFRHLDEWSEQSGLGMANQAPGLIFAEDDDVAPDLVWISHERLVTALHADGKLHSAPELVVEILSPGKRNRERDQQAKLDLYSRRGVQEYWIVDYEQRQVEIYRRDEAALKLRVTLFAPDELRSPLLPGFACSVSKLFSPRN
jgi:Uma2 family endonuclease